MNTWAQCPTLEDKDRIRSMVYPKEKTASNRWYGYIWLWDVEQNSHPKSLASTPLLFTRCRWSCSTPLPWKIFSFAKWSKMEVQCILVSFLWVRGGLNSEHSGALPKVLLFSWSHNKNSQSSLLVVQVKL